MEILTLILIIVGLCVFEIVSSFDNAVVNADVLSTMQPRYRRWFLVWGIFFSVFLVRGLLPWFIVWLSSPALGWWGALTATFSNDPHIAEALRVSAPMLLLAGGIFLIFLFLEWLFLEPKEYGLPVERFFSKQGDWFPAIVSVLLTAIIWFAIQQDPKMAFCASLGAAVFFITHGFKAFAARKEKEMKENRNLSDISKLVYLEILDASFSIDGVIGAFAFTMSVPLIIIGNGLGAVVVRELTIKGVDKIKSYVYLKNGAMYSICFLGIIMVLESFHVEIPNAVPPVVTIGCVGYFFLKSLQFNRRRKV